MAKRKAAEIEATAYHEAGHAVAAAMLHRPFKSASIVAADDYWGIVLFKPWARFQPDYELDLRTVDRIEKSVHTSLAGGIAEERFTGRWNRVGCSQDMYTAVNMAAFLHCDPEVCGKYIDFKMAECRVWVWEPPRWVAIRRVAAALLAKQTISAATVRSIIREIRPDDADMRTEQKGYLKWAEGRGG